jgi:hypothetical protein
MKANNSEMRMRFKNESFVRVDGSENYANADGMNPHFIIYDEFKHHDRRFHEAMEPNLVTNRAQILIMGTPPYGDNNFYSEVARRFQKSKSKVYYQLPSYYNTYLYPKGKDDDLWLKLEAEYSDRGDKSLFDREYRALSIKGGGNSIFPMFRSPMFNQDGIADGETVHVKRHSKVLDLIFQYKKDWSFYVTYDAGTSSCFAVLFSCINLYTREVVILDEIYEKNKNDTTAKRIYPRSVTKMLEFADVDDFYKTYDNAAAWFAVEVANEFEVGLMPCKKDVKKKEDKIGLIKDIMSMAGLLTVSDRCRWFCWEIDNYILDDNGKIPKEHDHLIDCFRYFLSSAVYSSVPEKKELPPDSDERIYKEKSVDHGCELLSNIMEIL